MSLFVSGCLLSARCTTEMLDGKEWEGRILLLRLGNEFGVCPTGAVCPPLTKPRDHGPYSQGSTSSGTSPTPSVRRGSNHTISSASGASNYAAPTSYPTTSPSGGHFIQSPAINPPIYIPNYQYPSEAEYWPGWSVPTAQYGPHHAPGFPTVTAYPGECAYPGYTAPPPLTEYSYGPSTYGMQSMTFAYGYNPNTAPNDGYSFPVLLEQTDNWIKPSPCILAPTAPGGLPVNLVKGAVVTEPRGVHVRNLPYDVTRKDLRDHLQEAGEIVRCEVPTGSHGKGKGKGKGYGTVLFKTQQGADRCLDMFDCSMLKGREIHIRRDKYATRKDSTSDNQY